jgi:hypothetical protein
MLYRGLKKTSVAVFLTEVWENLLLLYGEPIKISETKKRSEKTQCCWMEIRGNSVMLFRGLGKPGVAVWIEV